MINSFWLATESVPWNSH